MAAANSVGQRMRLVREKLGLSQRAIPRELGVGWRTYADYEGDQTAPGGKILSKLIELGFSSDWILAGRGEMMTESRERADEQVFSVPTASPLVDLRPLPVASGRIIVIVGDAMEPELREGDAVVVDLTDTDVKDRGLFAITLSDEAVVRRVVRRGDGNVSIQTSNPAYRDEDQGVSNCDIVGRVRLTIRQI